MFYLNLLTCAEVDGVGGWLALPVICCVLLPMRMQVPG